VDLVLKNGSSVLSAYEPIDDILVFNQVDDNPDRDFIEDRKFFTQKFVIEGTTLGHICEISALSRTTVKEVIKNLELRRSPHNRIFHGQVPYGWKLKRGLLVEHKGEQQVIAEIKQMRGRGESLRKIADQLNDRDVKSKNNKLWQAATILRLIKRMRI
jgi:hypothetical protein